MEIILKHSKQGDCCELIGFINRVQNNRAFLQTFPDVTVRLQEVEGKHEEFHVIECHYSGKVKKIPKNSVDALIAFVAEHFNKNKV